MSGMFLSWTKRFLSGGAAYALIGFIGFSVVQNIRLKAATADRDSARAERDIALAQVQNRNSVIESQSEQFLRRLETEMEKTDAENIIRSVPDSFDCQRSLPVVTAFEWLRQYEGASSPASDD